MAGVDPVVARRGGQQHARIFLVLEDVVVRRVLADVGPLFRHVRVAVLSHPRGARQHLVIAAHVEQRHLADDGVEQVGTLHQHGARQQAAIAAAHDAQVARTGDFALDQVLRHGDEVVIRALAVFLQRRLVPAGAEFAAAADIGQHIHAALFQPRHARGAAVAWFQRHFEAAIAIQHRGVAAVQLRLLVHDGEVGYLGAVLRRRFELFHLVWRGVVKGRQRLDFRALVAARRAQVQCGRVEEVGHRQEVLVRVDRIERAGGQGAQCRRVDAAALPLAVHVAQFRQAVLDLVQGRQQDGRLRWRDIVQRRGGSGGEQHLQRLPALHEGLEVGGQQRALRIGLAVHFPVRAQGNDQLVAHGEGRGVVRLRHLFEFRTVAQEHFAAVEIDLPLDELMLVAGREVLVGARAQVVGFGFIQGVRLRQRRAALPLFDDARVARAGHRAGAEIGGHEEGIGVDPAGAALRFGQGEAAVDKRACRHVVLAHDLGVAAAARQGNEAAFALRIQAGGAAPDPVFVLAGGQLVEVDHGFPGRFRQPVLRQGGAAPDAAHVLGVAPEIVVVLAFLADVGNAFLRVEDGFQARLQGREAGPGFQLFGGDGIVLLDPGQRLVAEDFFQPQVGIGVGGGRGGGLRVGDARCGQAEQHAAGESAI